MRSQRYCSAARNSFSLPERVNGGPQKRILEERVLDIPQTHQSGIIEEITDAFFVVDADWRFTFVNSEAAAWWKRDAQELIGRDMWVEFPQMVGSVFEPAYRRVAREHSPLAMHAFYDVTNLWYELRIFPMNGGIAASFRDTTAERTASQQLQRLSDESDKQRRLFQTMLSSTADFNYVFDLEGRFTYVNSALLELWQKTLPEAVGKNFFELDYPADLATRLQEQIQQVIRTQEPMRDETPYTSAFGTRAYEYIFNPVIDKKGEVEAVVGSTRDITDRKRSEMALREDAKRKDEFIATLAHELRNPLAPLRNALEVSRMAKGNDHMTGYAFDIMERQLSHMVRLIDDLLDLSRLTTGRVELKVQSIDLAEVLHSAIETARPHIDAAGHQLVIDAPDETFCVNADSTRLAQVFSNLLTNAAKFTPRGGKILLTVQHDTDDVLVTVKDNGIGLEQETLDRVFEMFAQVDTGLERTHGGLGIGLSLAKGIVKLHGGSVVARSAGKGFGSEFVVRLPLTGHKVGHAPSLAPVPRGKTKRRILVADDNIDAGGTLVVMLNLLGHQAVTVADGLEALKVAETFKPDVCLLDIGMPGMNGYEVARRMRETSWGKHAFLIALTGWGQDEDKRRSAEAGINIHLVKPVDPKALEALLASPLVSDEQIEAHH
ncbi:MAG: PAS domain-containing protein [Gemmatimonadaceae bacterium]